VSESVGVITFLPVTSTNVGMLILGIPSHKSRGALDGYVTCDHARGCHWDLW